MIDSTEPLKKIYAGWIHLRNLCRGDGPDDILCILGKDHDSYVTEDETLARRIENDIIAHGHYLSVHYFISDIEMDADALQAAWLDRIEGIGNAEYSVHYSDITGYLWTDENIKIGGHDLLEELKEHEGKYAHLEVEYSESPRTT